LPGYDTTTVPARGWASVKNGTLLSLIENAGFDAFITCDIEHGTPTASIGQ
jgi:hypothetical protein